MIPRIAISLLIALAAFLLDPLKTRPSGHMPNMKLTPDEAKAIAAYLIGEPSEADAIDAFRASLPRSEPSRTIALAALIRAASKCAAAPGHTAQPFQPTRLRSR